MAKCNLGKVRLKPVQSAVSPLALRDLRGGPLETCRAIVSLHVVCWCLIVTDHLFCILANLLAPSPPSLLVAGL